MENPCLAAGVEKSSAFEKERTMKLCEQLAAETAPS